MSRLPNEFRSRLGATGEAQNREATGLSQLFNYPSLWRLFEGGDAQALGEIRARLSRTNQDLERVIRHGSADDAARAGRASRAYGATLALLGDLEQLQKGARL